MKHGERARRLGACLAKLPRLVRSNVGGRELTRQARWALQGGAHQIAAPSNRLRTFFSDRREGRGIWKWSHYFDIYERHFNRFRGREVHLLEIGIFSGGSLEMWADYFGPAARIYGVDIEGACKSYESPSVKVFIGDQADRGFWQEFRQEVPTLDIVIDDGGHRFNQQIVTLEELLPHIRPGGVYLCEDIHGEYNQFAAYLHGMADMLNICQELVANPRDNERRLVNQTTPFQSAVCSMSLYPFAAVIEKNASPILELVAPKHGSRWEPFLE